MCLMIAKELYMLSLSKVLRAAAFPVLMATPSFSETFTLPAIGGAVEGEEKSVEPQRDAEGAQVEIINKHVVFVLDVSSSVRYDEKVAMLRGIAEALASPDNGLHFDGFKTYAVSVVYFAKTANTLDTVFVRSQAEAVEQISLSLWNFEESTPVSNLNDDGSSTNTHIALGKVNRIFSQEEENGYKTTFKSVVVFSDQKPDFTSDIELLVRLLAQDHRAAVHAVPIVLEESLETMLENEVVQYFARSVVTPSYIKYRDKYGGEFDVVDGTNNPITEYDQISKSVSAALLLDYN